MKLIIKESKPELYIPNKGDIFMVAEISEPIDGMRMSGLYIQVNNDGENIEALNLENASIYILEKSKYRFIELKCILEYKEI